MKNQTNQTTITYKAESYNGTCLGNSFMHRHGWQVVAYDVETGKRKYMFKIGRGKSPCYKLGWVAYHYESGANRADSKRLLEYEKEAKELAEKLNRKQLQASILKDKCLI